MQSCRHSSSRLRRTRSSSPFSGSRVASFFLAALFCFLLAGGPRSLAQQIYDSPGEEIVANLAAGRVILAVTKDAILIGTIENPIEVQTHVPAPVALPNRRAGVVLGAVDWFSPSSRQPLARLDLELPRLRPRLINSGPHMGGAESGQEAGDIEFVGQAFLERLNSIAQDLHSKVDLPATEPIVELILADYIEGYGPEVWQLNYSLQQEALREDYWKTSVNRPVYLQFYPPEKGQPHTLVEFDYPPNSASPPLLELLRQGDSRLQSIRASDPKMNEVADKLLGGECNKLASADVTQFLRAAMDAIAVHNARETFAIIREDSGFDWILRPPDEPKPVLKDITHEADAPSLIHH